MRRVSLLPFLVFLFCWNASGQSNTPKGVLVRGVELHYIEQGKGDPLILLHGGQGDYRAWGPQVAQFSQSFRVISYSRRYHYPNNNPLIADYRAEYTEADDLAAFIRTLRLGRVHLVGTSMGALTALVLVIKHPEMVRSLVLAEPPIHYWANHDPNGAALHHEFMVKMWTPAAAAFKAGDDQGAMKILIDGFAGTPRFDNLAPDARAAIMQNSRFFKAATSSSDPFRNLSKSKVKRLKLPVLIITGENTLELLKFINDELARLLPKAERAQIPNVGHASARENSKAFTDAVLTFLAR